MPREVNFNVRLSEAERAAIEAAARRVSPELTASAWARGVLMAATGPVLAPPRVRREIHTYRCLVCERTIEITADRGAPTAATARMARRGIECGHGEVEWVGSVEVDAGPPPCARCGHDHARAPDRCTVPDCACRRYTTEVDRG